MLWADENFSFAPGSSPLFPQNLGRRAAGIGSCLGRNGSPSAGLLQRKETGLTSCFFSHLLCSLPHSVVLPLPHRFCLKFPFCLLFGCRAGRGVLCLLSVSTSPLPQGGKDGRGMLLRGERHKIGVKSKALVPVLLQASLFT